MRSRSVAACTIASLVFVLGACASSGSTTTGSAGGVAETPVGPAIAPTHQNVTIELETEFEEGGHHVVVKNGSSVPITVTSVTITECKNIKSSCDTKQMKTTVPPCSDRRVLFVATANRTMESNFRYTFTWTQ